MSTNQQNTERLRKFVGAVDTLLDAPALDESEIRAGIVPLMKQLVAHDDWLPREMAEPDAQYYRQYLLYGDPRERFSVVSFVWGPGQKTPVHDHTVWGVIGVLRGAEINQMYEASGSGLRKAGEADVLRAGEVAYVSPASGDIHQVSNAFSDRVSISIHIYGGNIGRINRSVFDPDTAASKAFVSGYANAFVPNLWVG